LILDDEGTNSMHGIDKRKIFPANPRCAPLDAASQCERSGNPGTLIGARQALSPF
jgi:hypothetical protein